MSSVIHTVTYTAGPENREYQTQIERSDRLTQAGCQRILRREHPDAIVSRVELATRE